HCKPQALSSERPIKNRWCSSCKELERQRHHLKWQDSDAAGAGASVVAVAGGDVEVKVEEREDDAMAEEEVVTNMVTGGEGEEATRIKLCGLRHTSLLVLASVHHLPIRKMTTNHLKSNTQDDLRRIKEAETI
ncbi:hypothetical protein JD844_026906, partial [Phrynosoma platyrhinos]